MNQMKWSVMFGVEDVMKLGDLGAESFGEILSWEEGEIGEGVEAPELEKFQVGSSKFQVGEAPGEVDREGLERFWWNILGGG